MADNVYKSYDKTKNKLRTLFEDVRYLIALHLEVLKRIKNLEDKISLLWSSANTLYEDTRPNV